MTVDYFRELGYEYIRDPLIATDSKSPERTDFGKVIVYEAPDGELHVKDTEKFIGRVA